jgi:hypothetical protein
VLVVAFLALNASAPLTIQAKSAVPEFISSGQDRSLLSPGEVAMVIAKTGNAGMLWQAESGMHWRLVGGFINDGFEHRSDLPEWVQRMRWPTPGRVDDFEDHIRADHIGSILVDASHAPHWTRLFAAIGLTGHRTGGVVVYPADDCQTCHAVTSAEIRAAGFR